MCPLSEKTTAILLIITQTVPNKLPTIHAKQVVYLNIKIACVNAEEHILEKMWYVSKHLDIPDIISWLESSN